MVSAATRRYKSREEVGQGERRGAMAYSSRHDYGAVAVLAEVARIMGRP